MLKGNLVAVTSGLGEETSGETSNNGEEMTFSAMKSLATSLGCTITRKLLQTLN